MAGKELQDAAKKMAERKELLKKPVIMRETDPDNIRISKAEFIAKRRKENEEALAVEEFKRSRKATHPAIAEDGEAEEKAKRGRPKKVDVD